MSGTSITARVHITLKAGVVDPQGSAISQALKSLGFDAVAGVRVGKTVELDFEGRSRDEVTQDVSVMCERLLANPVIENFSVDIVDMVSSS